MPISAMMTPRAGWARVAAMDIHGAVPVGAQPVVEEVDVRRPHSVIAFAAWFTLGAGVAYLGYIIVSRLQTLMFLVALAALIGVTLDPLIRVLQARGLPRTAAALLGWLGAVAMLTVPLVLAVDAATSQLPTLIKSAPQLVATAESHLGSLGRRLQEATATSSQSTFNPTRILEYVLQGGALLLSTLTDVVIVAFLSLYFAIELPHLRRLSLLAIPASRQARAALIVDELISQVGRFMLSTVVIAVLFGAGTTVWALVWGVPYAVLLGALVTVFALVPVVGSTLGGVLVTLVSLTVSLPTAIATLTFYVGYRLAEDYVIQPRMMRVSVELPGVITVPSVILGGAILGIPGALFAVPVALVLRVLIREILLPATDRS
jgi:predicted PurR-regulated permease PerM